MLHINGMGYAHPEVLLDNKFIEDLNVGTDNQWIMDKIGIEKRLVSLPLDYIKESCNRDPRQAREHALTSPTELAVRAADMALQRAGITRAQIGMVVCNCCTPYATAPAEAQRIAGSMGMDALAYDVFTACPAVVLLADFVKKFKEHRLPDYILCVSTATLTHCVNFSDRTDVAIWGDGAAAWVLSPRHAGKLDVKYTYYRSDPTRCQAVAIDTYGFFHQDGRAIRDFSVRQTVRLIRAIESDFSIDWSRDVFIGHQANATMLQQITNNRDIPEASHWHNVTYRGNQAGAGAPASLAERWDDIRSGQKIVVALVGAGLSWGSMVLEAV